MKILHIGLLFACLACPLVFTAGEPSAAKKAMAGVVGLTLASTIATGNTLPSVGLLAAVGVSTELKQLWKPIAAGFVFRLAFEQKRIKKCLTKIRERFYLSLLGAALFNDIASILIQR
jgi:hypothetical protein